MRLIVHVLNARRLFTAFVLLIGAGAAVAVLSFVNTAFFVVNGSLAPVSKDLNRSIAPLAGGHHAYDRDFNVTYYYVKFVPEWPELYDVGLFRARDPGWQARLEAVGRSGDPGGTFTIALGGQTQITQQQSGGPYVPTTAKLTWQNTAQNRYSVLARAIFSQGGILATQLVNFTAEPMQRLRQWTFNCDTSTYPEPYSYCTTGQGVSLNFGWEGEFAPPAVSYSRWGTGTGGWDVDLNASVKRSGKYSLMQKTPKDDIKKGGLAALIWDVSNLGVTTDLEMQVYAYLNVRGGAIDEMMYVQFEIQKTDGTTMHAYYIREVFNARSPYARVVPLYDVINKEKICDYYLNTSSCRSPPPANHRLKSYGPGLRALWTAFFPSDFNLGADLKAEGIVKRIAFVTVNWFSGYGFGHWDDLTMKWRTVQCALPGHISTDTRGQSAVYISPSVSPRAAPSLATQVDAFGSGVVDSDYGYAVARYLLDKSPLGRVVPAAGTSLSVWSRYVRDSADAQNNAAFVAVGVDTNGDGTADREYVYYRTDGQTFALVSSFVNPGALICQGQCNDREQYVFRHVGTLREDQQWTITLDDVPGAVVAIAFGAVDATGQAAGTADDFWVYWDDLQITYSACDPPGNWSRQGYVWQSYNYLLVTGGTAYTQLVQNGLAYVANFTGSGRYVFLTPALADSFGVYWQGGGAGCVYGFNPPPATSRYVDIRPLQGLGDVLVRDQNGAILQRRGCQNPTTPTYIGFKANPGEVIKVYLVEIWG